MNNKKTKNLLISMVMFCAILFGLNKVNIVKADAPIRTTNSLSKKVVTANVKTNKYIVVPKKDTGSLQSKNGDSLSRGSSRGVDLVSYSYQFMESLMYGELQDQILLTVQVLLPMYTKTLE